MVPLFLSNISFTIVVIQSWVFPYHQPFDFNSSQHYYERVSTLKMLILLILLSSMMPFIGVKILLHVALVIR